jgi:cytochrome c oxidase cbb3-type subunit III
MADSREQDRLLDHSYDGIQEFDNPMPRWWVWIFYATIAFSVLYLIDRTGFAGPGMHKEYEQQLADAEARWPRPAGGTDGAALAALVASPAALEAGKTVYAGYCASCHAMDGGGGIGPNLADDYWLHGASASEIHTVVAEGVLAKGMPAWEKLLKPEQVDAVTAYVVSLRGTTPAAPKPPQGELVSR